jgi:hypothetical protein
MLSLFTIPKPFHGLIDVIQKNAIRSWTLLKPACRIILVGDEDGTAEAAAELGVLHIPVVRKNEYGTPFLDSIAEEALKVSRSRLLGYVNADIILLQDFMDAVKRLARRRPFLMIGQRWNLEVDSPLDFSDKNWQRKTRELARSDGGLHGKTGIDYFITRRDFWHNIPPFVIGRTAWDNYLVYKARKEGLDVIDATSATTVIHQNHDYGHVKTQKGDAWKGPEAENNLRLAGGYDYLFNLADVTHSLGERFVFPVFGAEDFGRRARTLRVLGSQARPLFSLFSVISRFLRGNLSTSGKSDRQ